MWVNTYCSSASGEHRLDLVYGTHLLIPFAGPRLHENAPPGHKHVHPPPCLNLQLPSSRFHLRFRLRWLQSGYQYPPSIVSLPIPSRMSPGRTTTDNAILVSNQQRGLDVDASRTRVESRMSRCPCSKTTAHYGSPLDKSRKVVERDREDVCCGLNVEWGKGEGDMESRVRSRERKLGVDMAVGGRTIF